MTSRRSLLVFFAMSMVSFPAIAQANEVFAGSWTGTWSNSLGETGDDTLVLSEGADGSLTGTWSGSLKVTGRRTGPSTGTLEGRNAKRAYKIVFSAKKRLMNMSYSVRRLDSEGSYKGKSRFKAK
jgi:hypothetical protein